MIVAERAGLTRERAAKAARWKDVVGSFMMVEIDNGSKEVVKTVRSPAFPVE
jgi:hypothetical protein